MSKKQQDLIDRELNRTSKKLLRKSKKQPAALILVLLIAAVLYVRENDFLTEASGGSPAVETL